MKRKGERKKRHHEMGISSSHKYKKGTGRNKCTERMRCQDPQCKLEHPHCHAGSDCKNRTCGVVHPYGQRCIKNSVKHEPSHSGETKICWKKHKCDDPSCALSHPSCSLECSTYHSLPNTNIYYYLRCCDM